MACLYTSYRTKTNLHSERFITWLCDCFCHAKYAGISGRAADAVLATSKRLHWSWPDCRNGYIEFYKLFMETTNGFFKISKTLVTLYGKFEKIKITMTVAIYSTHLRPQPVKHQIVV